MSQAELKSLAKLSKAGWKALATVDQEDPEELVKILKEVLEGIDRIEESEAQ